MRNDDKLTVGYRVFLRNERQFMKLLSLSSAVDPDPEKSKNGLIVAYIDIARITNIDWLVDFIDEESVSEEDRDMYIGLLTPYDENIIPIPNYAVRYFNELGGREILFSYTLYPE